MTIRASSSAIRDDVRRQLFDFNLVLLLLFVAGYFAWDRVAYFCIVIPAVLPLYFWLKSGAPGMPALPIVSAMSIQYYATPILRGEVPLFDPGEVLTAAVTVGGFLLSSAVVYWFFLQAARRRERHGKGTLDDVRVVKFAFGGMGAGLLFYVVFLSGWVDWLGTYFGVVRGIVYTFVSIACFLLGSARASGLLKAGRWLAGLGLLAALFVCAVSGLLLIGGVMNILAVILGYVVTARRIPWLGLAIAFALVSVLQAGKYEMRGRYWQEGTGEVSLTDMPAAMVDWVETGVDIIASGDVRTDALQRASLLWVVIRVQEATPEMVPYLGGETYAMLPAMLVPRFLEPNKIISQAALNLLAVRYGMQSEESTSTTTIGFGLVAEGFANFGFIGVVLVGAVFGALCGVITWFSSGVPATSLQMFVAIAATSVLLNLEADLSYTLVTMAQTVVAVLIVGFLPTVLRSALRPTVPGRDTAVGRRPLR